MSDTSPVQQDALPANRNGRLADGQARIWQNIARERRKGVRRMALPVGGIGLVLLVVNGPATNAATRFGVGVACLAAAVLIVIGASFDPLTADVRDAKIDAVEGAISKRRISSPGGTRGATYYVNVAGRRLRTGLAWFQAAPDAGIVRAYYFPRSRRLVNLESLPDRPLPSGPDVAQRVAANMIDALRSHDPALVAEARASAAALVHATEGPPPSSDEPQATLTREQLCGTWTNPFVTVVLADDGAATLTMLTGAKRSGHWSIDAAGRLMIDATGRMEPVEAWLDGDRLTVTMDGRRMAFTRVARPA